MISIAVTIRLGEIWVNYGLLGRNAASGVVDEEVVEQVETYVVERGDNGSDVGLVPLGKRGLEVGEGGDAGPVLLGGCAENAIDG